MTTIVADSKGMASDSCLQSGNTIVSVKAKKIQRIQGCLVGWAGSCADCQRLINALVDAKTNPVEYLTENPSNNYNTARVLILDKKNDIWGYDGQGAPYQINEKFASIGSGEIIALSALMAGATVQKATRIAIELDASSGGKMKYVKL